MFCAPFWNRSDQDESDAGTAPDHFDTPGKPHRNETQVPDVPRKPTQQISMKGGGRLTGGSRKPDPGKMKAEVDRLWEASQQLVQTDSLRESDVQKIRRIIQEAVDLSGAIRMLVREKEIYSNEDVEANSRDINNLQLLFHAVVEIWTKVGEQAKEKYATSVLADLMELATDICSVYGEVMSIFLLRFGLDISPLLRPVYGLFYGISVHCRYHCPDLAEDSVTETKALYNSFLTGLLGLFRSSKVLLKRLRFDQDVIRNRRRVVQSNITSVIETVRGMVKDGRHCSTSEYVEIIEKLGGLCTDIFFIIGKTSGIAELLELGEGVVAMGPPEALAEIAHSDITRCQIEQRPVVMRGLEVEDGGSLISDLFVQSGSLFNPSNKNIAAVEDGGSLISDLFVQSGRLFNPSHKVTIRMPYSGAALPPAARLKVKLKIGEDWFDTPGDIVDDMIEFRTMFMSGFIASVEYMSLVKPVTSAGYTYVCPEDSRVRVNFPEGCVAQTSSLGFKLIQINRSRMFEYKEHCPSLCRTIIAVSDCLKVDHAPELVLLRPVTVHLPIPNDIDDDDSEIVIFRSRDDGEVELIPQRNATLCPSAQNCYTFQVESFSGIAIGKVKKKQLRKNRPAVVEEYELYMEVTYICSILTFMDKSLLHVGMVKVWCEVVERRFVKRALRRRAKEGLFEVPGSRSPNLNLSNEDIICIDTDGNIQRMKEIPPENYFIVFLSSARDNFRSFPVEPRKDPDGRTFGLLSFFKDNEEYQKLLHTALIDTNRYLLGVLDRSKTAQTTTRGTPGLVSLTSIGASFTSRGTKSAREQSAFRAIFAELPVLSHQSILALSTYLTIDAVQDVAFELGIDFDDIEGMKLQSQPRVITNFEMLWRWRGAKPTKETLYILIQALRDCGHGNIAEKITVANDAKRALTKDDFV